MKSVVRIMLIVFILAFPALCYAFEPGEYVSFGTYEGEPIVWRVTHTDSGNAYLISDKIICLKSLDSEDADWSSSDLRKWLNSSADTDGVYNEPGFLNLSNFSEFERTLFVNTSHSVVLNIEHSSRANMGSEPAYYDYSPRLDEEKFPLAYRETVEDIIFLPDAEIINELYTDVNTFGVEYNMALPTGYAVSQLETDDICEDANWFYWTGDALSFSADLADGRMMDNTNKIISAKSYNPTVGVRPVCRISVDSLVILKGDGTEITPYNITGYTDGDGNPYVNFDKDGENIKVTVYGVSDERFTDANLVIAGYTDDRSRLTFADCKDFASYVITDNKMQNSFPIGDTAYVRVYIWDDELNSLANLTEWSVN